tara:strand:+ start:418 stop:663 length:246 start_codon:yes stop_codon:yes gene_type:complete
MYLNLTKMLKNQNKNKLARSFFLSENRDISFNKFRLLQRQLEASNIQNNQNKNIDSKQLFDDFKRLQRDIQIQVKKNFKPQ